MDIFTLAAFVRNTERLVIVTDADARITWVNEAFTRTTGHRLEEILGRRPRELLAGPETELEATQRIISATAARQTLRGVRLTLYKRDRSRYWVELELIPVFDKLGVFVAYVGLQQDITSWKQQEVRFAYEESLLNEAAKIGKVGAWDLELASLSLRWTNQVYAIHGMDPDVPVDFDRWATCLPVSARRLLSQAVRECRGFDHECEALMPSGQTRWVRIRGNIKQDFHGSAERIVGTCEDVTEQREQNLRTAELNERLRLAVETAQIGVWECSLNDSQCAWNEQLHAIYGMQPGRRAPPQGEWINRVHPDDRERVAQVLDDLKTGRCTSHAFDFRLGATPTSGIRHLHSVSRRLDGPVPKLVGTVIDVTDARNTQQANIEREAADRANRAKGEFLAHVSHELRTPLNGVMGFTQLLEIGAAQLQPKQQSLLKKIHSCSSHLLQLTDDLLDLAAIDGKALSMNVEPVTVGSVAQEVVALLEPAAAKGGIAVRIKSSEPAPVSVLADRRRLRQVLLNMVSNGIKYTKPGGTVTMSWQLDGSTVDLSIADTGQGVPPAKLDQLFQPFNRLGAESGVIEGTGLGLAITRGLVDAMNGQIRVCSEIGVGTMFNITLPAAEPALGDAVQAATDPAVVWTSEDAEIVKMLYVEDDALSTLRLHHALASRAGFCQIDVATNLEQTLQMLERNRYDLVLVDLDLPGTGDYQMLECLRARVWHRTTPCVAIASHGTPQDMLRALKGGFDDCWFKPLDLATLPARIERVLHPANFALSGWSSFGALKH
jgi:PAS domain S-box-containing protein